MDSAKTLIKSVARTFYGTQHVLVIDALMVHSALQNEDLAFVVNMQNKDLRDLCGTLRLDRMLAVHSRAEVREGQQRPINKDYYYIDFHATIDAIKYRVSHLEQKIKEMYDPNEEKKDFFCPRCKMQYTQIEILSLMDSGSSTGFSCGRCGNPLEREERSDGASTGTEMSTRFASQMGPFVDMLKKIDNEIIPTNDFETAFSMAVPVQRNEDTNSKAATVPLAAPKGPPTTVKGMTQVAAGPLDVIVTSSAERTAAEKAAEVKRKAAIAAQNTLPEWHAKSTVTGESVAVRKDGEQHINGASLLNEGEEDQKDGNKLDDELTAYYAQMAQEAEIEKQKENDPDSDDDEEEDDFEDVGIEASAIGTPSSSMSADPSASRDGKPNGILKRKESESGSSAPVTNTNTPAASREAFDQDDGPAAKKVKFEGQEQGNTNVRVEPDAAENQEKDSDEDDEAEFEDAL